MRAILWPVVLKELSYMNYFKHKKLELDDKEFQSFIKKQIGRINNLELIILKGHLLIEYLLNRAIETHSQFDRIDVLKMNFNFSHKVKICQILGVFHYRDDGILQQIIQLNQIRNNVAHTLEIDYNKLKGFLKGCTEESFDIQNDKEIVRLLKKIIPFLCGYLIGTVNAQIIIENGFKDIALEGKLR